MPPANPQTSAWASFRNLAISLPGAIPNKRLYSLLNCEALKYPTRCPAVPAAIFIAPPFFAALRGTGHLAA